MPSKKEKLMIEVINSGLKEIKVSHKDIAIERGVSIRAVRKMKKENKEAFSLFEDALKFRKFINLNTAGIRFITEFNDNNIYWLYNDNKKVIGFDEAWLRSSKLDDRELKNLRSKEIGETTIRDEEFKDSLIEKYCEGEIIL